jgi:hypothetical protein
VPNAEPTPERSSWLDELELDVDWRKEPRASRVGADRRHLSVVRAPGAEGSERPQPAQPAQRAQPATRRTVTITGRGSDRLPPSRSAYSPAQRRARERRSGRPERVAMWAVLLGVALAIGAATSSHGAVLEHVARVLGH